MLHREQCWKIYRSMWVLVGGNMDLSWRIMSDFHSLKLQEWESIPAIHQLTEFCLDKERTNESIRILESDRGKRALIHQFCRENNLIGKTNYRMINAKQRQWQCVLYLE